MENTHTYIGKKPDISSSLALTQFIGKNEREKEKTGEEKRESERIERERKKKDEKQGKKHGHLFSTIFHHNPH